ncbi:uncharacterized protein LOC105688597 [Athalia rosae]|uniref:uncharacterized protein LOC105688597 n=1 Tax=Athalia rosae TaxID=37344 RepID=UPI0020341C97|nr:uncharacterized protein LOC105688597 [Athalia rosae]
MESCTGTIAEKVCNSNSDGKADGSNCNLKKLKNASYAVGSENSVGLETSDVAYLLPSTKQSKGSKSPAGKSKRKSRSTRRRLNALTNNTSLHFSDTDSEGELVLINPRANNVIPTSEVGTWRRGDLPNPTISVTADEVEGRAGDEADTGAGEGGTGLYDFHRSERTTPNHSRRQSYVENLTDCDEIFSSDQEDGEDNDGAKLTVREKRYSLGGHPRETDYEDFSNDEEDADGEAMVAGGPIYVPVVHANMFADYNGETITTKEGDGPFSIEVRNQLSFDEGAVGPYRGTFDETNPDPSNQQTGTDSEDMDASDEENVPEDGGRRAFDEIFQDLDVAGTSQVVENLNKSDEPRHFLTVGTPVDDGSIDGHTDVEDIE